MQRMNITLSDEVAELVRSKVARGEYASESDVVAEGLRSLMGQNEELESWLLSSVAPAYDALRADPARAVSAEHVRARIVALPRG